MEGRRRFGEVLVSQSPYPWQPWQPGQQQWRGMLASHADRERAVDVLRAGFGEGRMEREEFEERVARAYAARTVGELAVLVADLPQGPVPPSLPAPYAAGAYQPLPRPRTNQKAVGAAVCGLLCVPTLGLTGIPAVVLGHAARSEIRRTGELGEGLALTGCVLGWLATAGWALVVVLLAVVSVAVG
ncbi:DUF1707 and DUF4190 domain-containing protein [Streptomyces sp. NPDC057413]|uniref:DUF1707 and DUF4190 domain-containing protein n=1 Tax=Streptomyces sp. NPDC057413 TaxID=3346124 RepID=UPI0036C6C926